MAAATGGTVQTTVNNIIDEVSPCILSHAIISAWKIYTLLLDSSVVSIIPYFSKQNFFCSYSTEIV